MVNKIKPTTAAGTDQVIKPATAPIISEITPAPQLEVKKVATPVTTQTVAVVKSETLAAAKSEAGSQPSLTRAATSIAQAESVVKPVVASTPVAPVATVSNRSTRSGEEPARSGMTPARRTNSGARPRPTNSANRGGYSRSGARPANYNSGSAQSNNLKPLFNQASDEFSVELADGNGQAEVTAADDDCVEVIEGILDTSRNGHGVLRVGYAGGEADAYISTSQIRRFNLRFGDMITGPARKPKESERYWGLLQVDKINGVKADVVRQQNRPKFKTLTPVYPDERVVLEIGKDPLSLRIIDMVAPIGKGQRSLIVSPPKAGKTTLLKDIASGVATNNPEIHLMAVLVGERPEEVTDIRRHLAKITDNRAEVAASNFDESAQDQCRVAELALERAKRLVEMGGNVVILLDSITRLARAYNLAMPTSGRTLSGGFDPAALFPPKQFFGAARNFEGQGSLTIIGTALIDTGSRMDDLIYEEFKGTGNQEIHLDRHLAERRIYPAIDVQRSGTRKDELLLDAVTYQSVLTLQRMLDTLDKEERTMTLINQMKRTNSNKEFLAGLKNA